MAAETPSTNTSDLTSPALIPLGHHQGKPPIPLKRPVTLVGSRHNAHLHLLSRQVSKAHAVLINSDYIVYIRDLASRTHVYVNGDEVQDAVLNEGDMVQIGSFKFQFAAGPGAGRIGRMRPVAPGMLEIAGSEPAFLQQRVLLIGRRPNCDLPLLDPEVSTAHAIIFEMNGRRYVRDLGSRTGTHVNGRPVHQEEISFGDELRIGPYQMRYVAGQAEAGAQIDLTPAGQEDLVLAEALPELAPEPVPVEPVEEVAEKAEEEREAADGDSPGPDVGVSAEAAVSAEPAQSPAVAESPEPDLSVDAEAAVAGGHGTAPLPEAQAGEPGKPAEPPIAAPADNADIASDQQLLVDANIIKDKLSSSATYAAAEAADEAPAAEQPSMDVAEPEAAAPTAEVERPADIGRRGWRGSEPLIPLSEELAATLVTPDVMPPAGDAPVAPVDETPVEQEEPTLAPVEEAAAEAEVVPATEEVAPEAAAAEEEQAPPVVEEAPTEPVEAAPIELATTVEEAPPAPPVAEAPAVVAEPPELLPELEFLPEPLPKAGEALELEPLELEPVAPAEAIAPIVPAEPESVDLSNLKLDVAPAAEAALDLGEASETEPAEEQPLLDLGVEEVQAEPVAEAEPPALGVEQGEVEAEPAAEKPRRRRKKRGEVVAETEQVEAAPAEEAQEPAVAAEDEVEAIEAVSAAEAVAPLAEVPAEVVEPTAPTPESALDLETLVAEAPIVVPEVHEETPDLTDTTVGRQIEELAERSLGPLVESVEQKLPLTPEVPTVLPAAAEAAPTVVGPPPPQAPPAVIEQVRPAAKAAPSGFSNVALVAGTGATAPSPQRFAPPQPPPAPVAPPAPPIAPLVGESFGFGADQAAFFGGMPVKLPELPPPPKIMFGGKTISIEDWPRPSSPMAAPPAPAGAPPRPSVVDEAPADEVEEEDASDVEEALELPDEVLEAPADDEQLAEEPAPEAVESLPVVEEPPAEELAPEADAEAAVEEFLAEVEPQVEAQAPADIEPELPAAGPEHEETPAESAVEPEPRAEEAVAEPEAEEPAAAQDATIAKEVEEVETETEAVAEQEQQPPVEQEQPEEAVAAIAEEEPEARPASRGQSPGRRGRGPLAPPMPPRLETLEHVGYGWAEKNAPVPVARRARSHRLVLLLVGLLIVVGAVIAGIWWFMAQQVPLSGSIRYSGAGTLTENAADDFGAKQRNLLISYSAGRDLREQAIRTTELSGRGPGFLKGTGELPLAVEKLRIDGDEAVLIVRLDGTEPADAERLRNLLQAVIARSAPQFDERKRLDQVIKDKTAARDEAQKAVTEIEDRWKRLRADEDSRPDPDVLAKARAEEKKAEAAWLVAKNAVADLKAVVSRLEAAPEELTQPEAVAAMAADESLQRLQKQLTDLKDQLAGRTPPATQQTQEAKAALDEAMKQFAQTLDKAQGLMKDDPALGEYLTAAHKVQNATQKMIDGLLQSQSLHQQELVAFKKKLDDDLKARREERWAGDAELKKLRDLHELTDRNIKAAEGSNGRVPPEEIKRLQAQLAELEQQVKLRQMTLADDPFFTKMLADLTILVEAGQRQLDAARADADTLLHDLEAEMQRTRPSVEKLPVEQQTLANSLRQRLEEMKSARQKYAQAMEAAHGAEDFKLLSEQATALQTKVSATRTELARNAIDKALKQKKQALADAATEEAKAADAYQTNEKSLAEMERREKAGLSAHEAGKKIELVEKKAADAKLTAAIEGLREAQSQRDELVLPVGTAEVTIGAVKDHRRLFTEIVVGMALLLAVAVALLSAGRPVAAATVAEEAAEMMAHQEHAAQAAAQAQESEEDVAA